MNGLAVSPDGKLIVITYEKGDTAFIYLPVDFFRRGMPFRIDTQTHTLAGPS
jgi:hypothetical protein